MSANSNTYVLMQELSENDQSTCPICMRSIADLGAAWQMRDAEIARVPMPEEYAHWRVRFQGLPRDHTTPLKKIFHAMQVWVLSTESNAGPVCFAPGLIDCGSITLGMVV